MSRKNLLGSVVLSVLAFSGTAFGWAGNTHALLCQRNFDLPVMSMFLSGIEQSAVENYVSEPSQDSHNMQWYSMVNRKYIDTATACPNGFNWNSLDETTRLQYLMHHVGDVSVPAHHAPAGEVYDSTYAEGLCEAAAAAGYLTVDELPNVANTTYYTHTRNGNSYSFTGTIDQVVSTYYNACRNNASWFKSTRKWWGHYPGDIASANWNGLVIDLMLQRAVFVDYFFAKWYTVVVADKFVSGSAGGMITLDNSDAYDPDCISWNSDGTYSRIYGVHPQGIQYFQYDFNRDGVWDYTTTSNVSQYPVNTLIAMGIPTNQWTQFYASAVDNEGKSWTVGDYLYLSAGGVPEPATMSLLALGGLALLRRRK